MDCVIISEYPRGAAQFRAFLDFVKKLNYPYLVDIPLLTGPKTTFCRVFKEIDKAVSAGCTRLFYYKDWGHGDADSEGYEAGEDCMLHDRYRMWLLNSQVAEKLIELRDLEQVVWFSTGCQSWMRIPRIVDEIKKRGGVKNAFITCGWEMVHAEIQAPAWPIALQKHNYDMVAAAKWIVKVASLPGDLINPYLGWANLTGKSVVSIKPTGAPPSPPPTKRGYLDCKSNPSGAKIWIRGAK